MAARWLKVAALAAGLFLVTAACRTEAHPTGPATAPAPAAGRPDNPGNPQALSGQPQPPRLDIPQPDPPDSRGGSPAPDRDGSPASGGGGSRTAPTLVAATPQPVPSPTPAAGGSPAPGRGGSPAPTLVAATPEPVPSPALRRLTSGGCCTQPFWSADSRRVLFIDRPAPDAPVGIWGVDATRPDPTPALVTERLAFYTSDMVYLVEVSGDTTIIERLPDPATGAGGDRWTVPAGGRSVSFSPGRTRIAWQASNDAPFERRVAQIWVANLDGSQARQVANLARGSLAGWASDDMLLLSSRESLETREQILTTLSLVDGTSVELVRSDRLRGGLLSPDGQWLAYYIALSEEPADNGLWLVRTDGTGRRRLSRAMFGAYQWRDAGRLLIVPFRPDAVHHELWELDVETGEARRLTDPAITPFKIANGDWHVSPDGRFVAFVESQDRNIWVLALD